jgi:hypothetical protein
MAGFPNGRRLADDTPDIELRALAGGTPFTPDFNIAPNNKLGDGVNTNDTPFLNQFPYVGTPTRGTPATRITSVAAPRLRSEPLEGGARIFKGQFMLHCSFRRQREGQGAWSSDGPPSTPA